MESQSNQKLVADSYIAGWRALIIHQGITPGNVLNDLK